MSDQSTVPAGTRVTGIVPPDEDIISMLGGGVHTGLRKGTEAPSAHGLWLAISDSEDGAWAAALNYALWGLRYSGWQIVKVEENP